ncbi:MAG: threonine/serine exporter family protein [Lachnospiraceae bacterium]|nr:threonine/serine exporter family protein [Lachnospiraceae bacterium]
MKVEEVMDVALDIGERMLESGSAVNRVEDTIFRICDSYGLQHVEVFTLNSLSFVSATAEDGRTITKTKRMRSYSTNLHQTELLNELSRYVCRNRPTREEIERKKEELLSQDRNIGWVYLLGYMLGTGAFTIFYGGILADAIATAMISVFVFLLNRYAVRIKKNTLIYTGMATFMIGVFAILLTRVGISAHVDKVIIGDIMLFIPGLAIVNAVRDMLYGDVMTGFFRLVEAILVAGAIACGIALSLILLGGILA